MVVAAFAAVNGNTTWSGHVEAYRVQAILSQVLQAFLWSYLLLLLAAWLRARFRWDDDRPVSHTARRVRSRRAGPAVDPHPFGALPWTDRWLRDWRETDARTPREATADQARCRHGAPLGEAEAHDQPPVLRALGVSHLIVAPGAEVAVTWCFQGGRQVLVDGSDGHPACGEALVRIDRSRRIELVASNPRGRLPVATARVVAMRAPQLDHPGATAPPPVALRTDISATMSTAPAVSSRLDDFWNTRDAGRPTTTAPRPVIGVPTSFARVFRRGATTTEEA